MPSRSGRRGRPSPAPARVERANATFQQWEALLSNRTKRHRAGRMVVQGVRPVTLAVEHGHRVRELLFDGRPRPSGWARDLMSAVPARVVAVAPVLMARLGGRDAGPPELLAVVDIPTYDLDSLDHHGSPLVVVFDRPSSPGNIGSLVRSADALGASAVVTTGHGADPWDPASVRASTGSVFAIPVLSLPSHKPVLGWVAALRERGVPMSVVGADESGTTALPDTTLTGPTVLVVGNETRGMSSGWLQACDTVTSIPMVGAASSLNAANAGTVALYEALRQRLATRSGRDGPWTGVRW